jgi:hypothetical protein
MPKNMQLEDQILVLSSRTQLNAEQTKPLQTLLAEKLDWHHLRTMALRHHVLPLLYQNLRYSQSPHIPNDVLDHMREDVAEITRYSLLLTSELFQLLDLLAQHNIPVVPFKGPLLAIQAYANLALREYGDLDLIIRRTDFQQVRDLLVAHGYEPNISNIGTDDTVYLSQHHDYELTRPDVDIVVEVQWGLMQEPFCFPLDSPEWWERIQSTPIAGRVVPSFSLEDTLLILCIHGSKHLWERLVWICDIVELLRRNPQINWDALIRRAEMYGSQRMLGLGLFLAESVFEAEIPADVRIRLYRNSVVRELAAQVCNNLFDPHTNTHTLVQAAPLFYLRMMHRWRDRLHLSRRLLPALAQPVKLVRTYHLRPLKHLFGR